jgi:hypothetical protein
MEMAETGAECKYCGGLWFHKRGIEWRVTREAGKEVVVIVCKDKPLAPNERVLKMPPPLDKSETFIKMPATPPSKSGYNMKVWTLDDQPVGTVEPLLNFLHTAFCTDERHRKCVARGICLAAEPQCEWDKLKLAKMSRTKWDHTEVSGTLEQQIEQRRKLDVRIAAALARYLRACKPYVLSWEPFSAPKGVWLPRKKPLLARKKRCRPRKN